MQFLKLQIDGFGKIENRTIEFKDGVNIVYGRNEAGKSTLHACIKAMLFGLERAKGIAAKTDTWSHYKPWNTDKYAATLYVENGDHTYRIRRDFFENPTGVRIFDETLGEYVSSPEVFLNTLLLNLTSESFDNSVSIGQLKSATDKAMAEEIKRYIVNANTTGNTALNCAEAKEFLNTQKEDLERELVPEAMKKYAANAGRIKKLEEEIADAKYINKTVKLTGELDELETKNNENEEKIRTLSATIDDETAKLNKSKLTTKEAIDQEREDFEYSHAAYVEHRESHMVRKYRAAWIIFTVLMLAAFAAAFYVWMQNMQKEVLYVTAAAFVIFLVLTIIFIVKVVREKNEYRAKKDALTTRLLSYGLSDEISKDNLDGALSYLDGLKRLAVDVGEKKDSLGEIEKEQEEIIRQKDATKSAVSSEEAFQSELRYKLLEIRALKNENIALSQAAAKNDVVGDDIEAIEIALENIDRIAEEYKDSVGLYLNREVSKFMEGTTNGAYSSVSIDDNLDVWLNTSGRMVKIDSVSSGASDQIYLALRLAMAKLLQGRRSELPLLFDDSFVNYDDERCESALKWIADTYDNQIIVFTCHERESAILESAGVSFNKIELDEHRTI